MAQASWMMLGEGGLIDDLAHLQRLYRITEGDRKAYSQNTKITLLKQRKLIHKLECEKHEIVSRSDSQGLSAAGSGQVQELLESYQKDKRKLQEDRHVVQNQKSEIRNMEKAIQKLLLAVAQKCAAGVKEPEVISRKLSILEDKMENSYVHLNRVLCQNKRLRSAIEHLMKRRKNYKRIRRQLHDRLTSLQSEINDLTSRATHAYNTRAECSKKLESLKTNQAKDERACHAQLQEAQRMVEQQKNWTEFYVAKGKKRGVPAEHQLIVLQGQKRQTLAVASPVQSEAVNENFEMFTYCSHLNNKIEETQREIVKLQNEIKIYEEKEKESESGNQQRIAEIQMAITSSAEETAEAEMRQNQSLKVLAKLKAGIEGMLQLIGGDVTLTAILDPASEVDEVSGNALLMALKEIERTVNELMQTRKFLDEKEEDERAKDLSVDERAYSSRGVYHLPRFSSDAQQEALVEDAPPSLTMESADDVYDSSHLPLATSGLILDVTSEFNPGSRSTTPSGV